MLKFAQIPLHPTADTSERTSEREKKNISA